MTSTRTPIQKLPFAEALKAADKALLPHLGKNIGNGWIFNGGVPYQTEGDRLLYNLTIQQERPMNEIDEGEQFYVNGLDTVIAWLREIGIISIAHWAVRADEADIAERLREL